MAESIKIRAAQQGEWTEIRILMRHPMENGLRKNEAGQVLPAHFIQTFQVLHNSKVLIDGQLNTSVSRDPLFAFRARGIKVGDKLAVSWLDNQGVQRSDEISAS
ncbi:MAG: hypothetical protein RIR00_1961 [Pseudomonadota bacterium]|jgi:sulfur-oxidizing protein SoxZ